MHPEEAQIRIEKLKAKIQELNYQYFVLDQSKVEESVRDSLKRELHQLETKFPQFITSDSPTQRVGSTLSGKFAKIKHSTPKKSLADVFTTEEIEQWFARISKMTDQTISFICELKIDGLNVTLQYQKGLLKKAVTRGNGLEGEDVTHSIRTIKSIPLKLKQAVDLEVSGEVFLSKKDFEKLNQSQEEKGLPTYANPRNTAAGSVRQLDPEITASRNLDMFSYQLDQAHRPKNIKTQSELLQYLQSLGLKIEAHSKKCQSIQEVLEFCQKWTKKREKLAYEIDGIVIKVDSLDQQSKMGSTAKAPRYSVAYKFPAIQVTSQILDVIFQVGRTGAITPVAVLKPTLVDGSTVSRATLHNQDEIQRKDIKLHDTVIIQKAGDIIPEVVEVLTDLRTGQEISIKFPKNCPVCNQQIFKEEDQAAYYCRNYQCPAINKESISHFVSKKGFNIDGLGIKVITQLIDQGLILDPADLFSLEYQQVIELKLFKEKRSKKLIESIAASHKITLKHFLYALGIRHLGERGSEDFANFLISHSHQKELTISQLIELLHSLSEEEIINLDGFGNKIGNSVYSWFLDEKNIQYLQKLEKNGIQLIINHKSTSNQLKGQSFVITGTLASYTRDQAKELIKSKGGKVQSSISAKTNYLLAGESAGSKLSKAQKLGVKVINEEELLQLIN